MAGAFARRNTGQIFMVVSAVRQLTPSNGLQYCTYAHDALYDDNMEQKESLLSTHHALTNISTSIDDRSISERDIYGRQST